ncbi:MAG: hypothetical protein ACRC6X_03405 [Culicoidibacterales bacterium]
MRGKLIDLPREVSRIIQQAMNQVLMNIYDVKFHDNSFGFRPNRSDQQAVPLFQLRKNS